MRRVLGVGLAAVSMCCAGAASAQSQWSASVGAESFKWEESTSPTVEESGLRWALDLTWQQSRQPGLSMEYNIKFYQGNVDYTGASLFPPVIPISNETKYRGLQNEIRAVYRVPQSMFDVVLAGGWDRWERKLKGTGQQEDYDVVYVRLGAGFNSTVAQGVIASIGAKYPVYTRENAHFETIGASNNPRLKPGKDVSMYGTIGYRFNPKWDVIGYYDSYRFKESNVVSVLPFGGFVQPESKMDLFGVKVQHNF